MDGIVFHINLSCVVTNIKSHIYTWYARTILYSQQTLHGTLVWLHVLVYFLMNLPLDHQKNLTIVPLCGNPNLPQHITYIDTLEERPKLFVNKLSLWLPPIWTYCLLIFTVFSTFARVLCHNYIFSYLRDTNKFYYSNIYNYTSKVYPPIVHRFKVPIDVQWNTTISLVLLKYINVFFEIHDNNYPLNLAHILPKWPSRIIFALKFDANWFQMSVKYHW